MSDARVNSKDARRWPRRLAFALTAALVAAIALSGGGFSATDNVHGAVYDWARANPGQDVPVLVQTDGDSDAIADFVRANGGTVQRQFQIISALEADIPPSFVSTLASHPDAAWVSLDAPVLSTDDDSEDDDSEDDDSEDDDSEDDDSEDDGPATAYPFSVKADDVWASGYTGAGVGVAVVDTGISPTGHEDFKGRDGNSRVLFDVVVNPLTSNVTDGYGHGTHVAGIIAGDGDLLEGRYIGIAPDANLLNVKVADDAGNASVADVIAGLEFIYNNKDVFNIRVVNLSLHSSVALSYKVDPLCAAAEVLWFNGIFVVAAAGNQGGAPDAVHYCPGSDPFVMTVGAFDDAGTATFGDDVPAPWSSIGVSQDGVAKPELLTPGRHIVSVIDSNSILYNAYGDRVVDVDYFRLSGTSMAAGVMSGVAALVFERHPDWTPGEVKCTLIVTSRTLPPPHDAFFVPQAFGAVAQWNPSCNSDNGLTPSDLLFRAPLVVPPGLIAYVLGEPDPEAAANQVGLDLEAAGITGATLESVDWSVIRWGAIDWSAIRWGAIRWGAIEWDAIPWEAIDLEAIEWEAIRWGAIEWDTIRWGAIRWGAIRWGAIRWGAIRWGAIRWSMEIEFDALRWSTINWDVILAD